MLQKGQFSLKKRLYIYTSYKIGEESMNLLSNTGTRALNNFYNGVNKHGESNLSVLQNMSVYNSYTGKNHGFNMS